MNIIRRIMYLGYYFRKMDWELLLNFMNHSKKHSATPYTLQLYRLLRNSLVYNISPLEYYQFKFERLSSEERNSWAGTGTMYEFQLQANPIHFRGILLDKIHFSEAYSKFIKHKVVSIKTLLDNNLTAEELLNTNQVLVCKNSRGSSGREVKFIETKEHTRKTLIAFMKSHRLDMIETLICQHNDLQCLAPAAVNTVRIFTLIASDGSVTILGCRLRISVSSNVDNMAAGNLAAPIDAETGIVNGPGVYSDIRKPDEHLHPITKLPIIGFQIPFWRETIEMATNASLLHPQNRSIGWDIAVTPNGPDLIEGNHDWCKLVWQMPVKQGLKRMLIEERRSL